jgi:hypothetical protein
MASFMIEDVRTLFKIGNPSNVKIRIDFPKNPQTYLALYFESLEYFWMGWPKRKPPTKK